MKSFLIILSLCFIAFAQSEFEKQGREIFEKYHTAIGGKENWDKIKTVEIISESEGKFGKRKTLEIEDKENNKRYIVMEDERGKLEIGFDGKRSWMRRGGRSDYTNINNVEGTINYVKLPNEIIDGKEYLVVEEKRADSRTNSKTYFDPNTFFLLLREKKVGLGGNVMRQTTAWADYRKVGAVFVPFLEVTDNEMTGKVTKKILSVTHNIAFDSKTFELNGKGLQIPKEVPVQKNSSSTNQPIVFTANKNVIYKDEDGKVISQEEFKSKQLGANYSTEAEISEGKMVGLKLKPGNPETSIGGSPPDFTATALDTSLIQLSQLKGKVVVLNFWFIACGPCIKEMPELNELVKKYQGKDVEFIAITYDREDLVAESIKNRPFNYKQIVDAQNIIDLYKVTAFPTHLVIDKEGKILLSQLGNNSKIIEQLNKIIDLSLS